MFNKYVLFAIISILVLFLLTVIVFSETQISNSIKPKEEYLLKTYGKNVALYKSGEMIEVYNQIVYDVLPESDKKRLDSGIVLSTIDEVNGIIEDYDG